MQPVHERRASARPIRRAQTGRDAARNTYRTGAAGAPCLDESMGDDLDDSPATLAAAVAKGALVAPCSLNSSTIS